MGNVEFRILGPLEAVVDGRPVPLGGPKQRSLLALLLVRAGNVVSADQLIDEIWGADAPPTVRAGLHVYLSRLRRLLGSNGSDGLLVRHAHGYALMLELEQLDATRFDQLAREGREALARGEAARAADMLSDALSMWRGPALADLAHVPFAEAEARRLEDLRLQTVENRIAADLQLGRASEVVAELQTLIAAHPYREGLRGQLMLALYQLGRQADALEAYAAARRILRDELGLEPSQELRQLEQAILQQDDALDAAPAVLPVERQPAPPTRRARDRRSRAYPAAGAAVLAAVAVVTLALAPWSDDRLERVPADAVGAIDPASNRVVASIPVGAQPAAVAAGGDTLWVANALDGSVSRIDLRRRRAVRAVAVGGNPGSLTASSSSVWVPTGERTQRIDPRFDTVVTTVAVGRGSSWARASVPSARFGRTVWVADGYGIAQIDERTNKVVRRVATGDSPSGIATHGNDVWVSDNVDNTVTRIEPTNATTVLPVGREPTGIAAAAGALWVAQAGDNSVLRIDPDGGTVVTTIPVGRGPTSVAGGGGAVWVANSADGTVTRIDPDDNRVVATVEVGGRPQGLVFADGVVWVANRGAPATGGRDVRGGTARFVGHADIDAFPEGLSSLDPAVSFNSDVWKLFYATCAKLVNYVDARAPAGSQLVPEVAAAMPSISKDRRTYTFTIRDGFRFSPPSGAPVTAATFKHTIERTLNPKLRSPAADVLLRDVVGQSAYAAGRTSHLHGVAARGNRLTITLTRPDPAFLAKMATPFFCAVPTDTPMQPVGPRPIPSAGPYSFTEHIPHQRVVLTRNPNYAGDRPQRLERAVYTFGASSSREIARDVEAGRADYALDGIDDADEARLVARYGDDIRRGRPTLVRNATGGIAYLILNATRPLFGSTRLRRAVNFAIDRTALTAALPGGTPTDQYLPPTIPGFRDARVYPFRPDVPRATRLAGTARRTAVMYTCNERWCRTVAQILRRDLRRLGIDVRIEQFPFAELYDRENTPGEPFDIGFLRWAPAIVDPGDVLDPLDGSPFFRDETWLARLRDARRLTGRARYRAYGALDVALARDAAPFAAFAVLTQGEFFSARLGCQIAHPVYGIDIAALCLRSRTEGG